MAEDTVISKCVASIDCKQGAVRAARFNVDGNYCLTCGSDKSLKLWNPYKGILLKSYSGHGYEVLDAKASGDSGQLCSCSMDKTIILWDVASGQVLRKYRGHAGCVNCVEFNEESTVILSGSIDGTVKAWDCRSRKNDPIQTINDAKDSITSVQVSDHEILTGSADGRVRRYDLRMGRLMQDYVGGSVTSVSFTRDGQCILVSSLDNTLRLMDKDSGEMLNEYTGHTNKEYKIDSCLNHKDTHIISGSEDLSIYIWDLVEGKVTAKLKDPNKKLPNSICHHPSEAYLVSTSGMQVHLWMNDTGSLPS